MAGQHPVISVVIPAFKCEAYLPFALDSVLQQTLAVHEVLVIDDASPDGTGDLVRAYARRDARIQLLVNEHNLGVAASRNRGVASARGEWIAFLDADDIWAADKLACQMRLLMETQADLCYTGYRQISHEGAFIKVIHVPDTVTYRQLLYGNVIGTSSVVIKKAWMDKHPMEREDLHEDYIAWLSILRAGAKAVGIDRPLWDYRLTESSKSRNKLKAARMTYGVYRHMGIGRLAALRYFIPYAFKGVAKYAPGGKKDGRT